MLRALVVILLLANAGFFAWTQGWLDSVVGARAAGDRDTQRLAQQVRPDTVRLLPTQEPPRPKPVTRCLEAGPFDATEVSAAEAALAASPAASALVGRFSRLSTETPGVWIIAVGRAAPHEAQLKKLAELKRLDIAVEVVKPASGVDEMLSIGKFDSLAAAKAALEPFAARGVHTGRVVEISPASEVIQLRVDNATPPEATALEALPAGTAGKGFVNCEIP
jgi:hypothetical protein